MDLRVKKTTQNIKSAFFELRKRKSIEKISVKELSELAMINKATFYLHYRDIYDLSDRLEDELIEKIIDAIRGIRLRQGGSDNLRFIRTLSNAILQSSDDIRILFSGYDNNHFINHLETRLKDYIFSTFPYIPNNDENNIRFTIMIQGSYHSHIRNRKIGTDKLTDISSNLLLRLL